MKQIPLMDHAVRQDHFGIRFKNLPRDLTGKTLGLAGLGRIGSELARICHSALEMHILFDSMKKYFRSWLFLKSKTGWTAGVKGIEFYGLQ